MHIATHVKVDGNSPEDVTMLLGNGNTLSMAQIDNDIKNISVDLLVLSGCDTGALLPQSKSKQYDGLSNLFHLKGADKVISTLWAINDQSTSIFMGIFYDLLSNNDLEPSEALTITKRLFAQSGMLALESITLSKISLEELKTLGRYKDPFYWAPFQLTEIQ